MGKDRGGDWCSICGAPISLKGMESHKCNPKVLAAIDAAHARGEDWTPPDNRTVADRIKEGNDLLRMAGGDDGE